MSVGTGDTIGNVSVISGLGWGNSGYLGGLIVGTEQGHVMGMKSEQDGFDLSQNYELFAGSSKTYPVNPDFPVVQYEWDFDSMPVIPDGLFAIYVAQETGEMYGLKPDDNPWDGNAWDSTLIARFASIDNSFPMIADFDGDGSEDYFPGPGNELCHIGQFNFIVEIEGITQPWNPKTGSKELDQIVIEQEFKNNGTDGDHSSLPARITYTLKQGDGTPLNASTAQQVFDSIAIYRETNSTSGWQESGDYLVVSETPDQVQSNGEITLSLEGQSGSRLDVGDGSVPFYLVLFIKDDATQSGIDSIIVEIDPDSDVLAKDAVSGASLTINNTSTYSSGALSLESKDVPAMGLSGIFAALGLLSLTLLRKRHK